MRAWLYLACALTLAILAYRPGLTGPFLFDDFANLTALGDWGPLDVPRNLLYYLTSGTADLTGRPIALASFLLDARTWPADPYPFKRTNLLLHLLNGVLLYALLARLGRAVRSADDPHADSREYLAAALASAMWLLHPLFVSTTLYVVQREAMLPATFTLAGLWGLVILRDRAATGTRGAVWLIIPWLGLFTVLGTLSKANGALLPLLAGVVEIVLLARLQPIGAPLQADWRRARTIALWLPSFAVVTWLAGTAYDGFAHGLNAIRPWTLGERLLTQARVVATYLRELALPQPYSRGLFNDDIVASTGWLAPPSTLICALLLAALAVVAWAGRRRAPSFCLAISFFFAGHLMESTVVPLELYFEHRNYLPAMLLFWPLSRWLAGVGQPLPRLRAGLALALPTGLALLTWMGASLWGNADEQALLWARRNPDSPRAQAYAAQVELERGQVPSATHRLQVAAAQHPSEIQLTLNLVGARCAAGEVDANTLALARESLRTTRSVNRLGYDWFSRALEYVKSGSCRGLDDHELVRLLDAVAANKRAMEEPGRRQDLHHLRGQLALLRGDAVTAVNEFDAALAADLRPAAGLQQAAVLASAGHPDLALRHLDTLRRSWRAERPSGWSMASLQQRLLLHDGYWEREIDHLQSVLLEEKHGQDARAALPPTRS